MFGNTGAATTGFGSAGGFGGNNNNQQNNQQGGAAKFGFGAPNTNGSNTGGAGFGGAGFGAATGGGGFGAAAGGGGFGNPQQNKMGAFGSPAATNNGAQGASNGFSFGGNTNAGNTGGNGFGGNNAGGGMFGGNQQKAPNAGGMFGGGNTGNTGGFGATTGGAGFGGAAGGFGANTGGAKPGMFGGAAGGGFGAAAGGAGGFGGGAGGFGGGAGGFGAKPAGGGMFGGGIGSAGSNNNTGGGGSGGFSFAGGNTGGGGGMFSNTLGGGNNNALPTANKGMFGGGTGFGGGGFGGGGAAGFGGGMNNGNALNGGFNNNGNQNGGGRIGAASKANATLRALSATTSSAADTIREGDIERTLQNLERLHREKSKARDEDKRELNAIDSGSNATSTSGSNTQTARFAQIATVAGRQRATNRIKPRGSGDRGKPRRPAVDLHIGGGRTGRTPTPSSHGHNNNNNHRNHHALTPSEAHIRTAKEKREFGGGDNVLVLDKDDWKYNNDDPVNHEIGWVTPSKQRNNNNNNNHNNHNDQENQNHGRSLFNQGNENQNEQDLDGFEYLPPFTKEMWPMSSDGITTCELSVGGRILKLSDGGNTTFNNELRRKNGILRNFGIKDPRAGELVWTTDVDMYVRDDNTGEAKNPIDLNKIVKFTRDDDGSVAIYVYKDNTEPDTNNLNVKPKEGDLNFPELNCECIMKLYLAPSEDEPKEANVDDFRDWVRSIKADCKFGSIKFFKSWMDPKHNLSKYDPNEVFANCNNQTLPPSGNDQTDGGEEYDELAVYYDSF